MPPTPARTRAQRVATWLIPLVLGVAAAQALALSTLAPLLPGNTVAAFGLSGAGDAAARLGPLGDAWREAGAAEGLVDLLASLGVDWSDLPDPGALLGQEAFIGIGADRFAPLPAVTLLASVDPTTAAQVAERVAATGGESYREGALAFTLLAGGRAVAIDGSLVAVSSNADTLRAVLRLRAGAPETRFDQLPGVQATLGALPEGFAVAYVDPGAFARALEPLARGLGFDASVARFSALLRTIGPSGGVMRLDDHGLTSVALRQPPADPPDRALHALLTKAPAAPRAWLTRVPASEAGVTIAGFDPAAWFAYLAALSGGMRELGVPDLARTLRDLTGIDVERDLLAWTAPGTIGVAGAGGGGPVEAFGVIGVASRDDDAAAAGLERTFQRVHALAGALGRSTPPPPRERVVAGATLRSFDLLPDLRVAFAVKDGVAWMSGDEAALERVLIGAEPGPPAAVAEAFAAAPTNAEAMSFGRVALVDAAGWLTLLPPVAAAAGDRIDQGDFALAITRLSDALRTLAPHVGASVAWSGMDEAGRWRREERTWLDRGR